MIPAETKPTAPKRGGRRPLPPAALRREEAAPFLSMGVSTFDRADAAGLVPAAAKIGGVKCWGRAELAAWVRHGCPDRETWAPLWRAITSRRYAAKPAR